MQPPYSPATLAIALAWAAASVGCSGSPGINPADTGADASAGDAGATDAGATIVCAPGPEVVDPTAVIDDMEDRNALLAATPGQNGSWWAAADDTPEGTLEPRMPIPELIPGGRCGSEFAMRVTGQGFVDWGALLGLSFAYAPGPDGKYDTAPYDAHIRQGIRFWARVGDTSIREVQFTISDRHDAPVAGVCADNATPPCFSYQVALSKLDTSWKQFTIPFAALVHPTPGMPSEPIDTTTLQTVTFFFHASAVFDFWVDDIEFY